MRHDTKVAKKPFKEPGTHSTRKKPATTLILDPFELALSYPKFGETSFEEIEEESERLQNEIALCENLEKNDD